MTSPKRATLLQPGRFGDLSKMLEPYDGKSSRTVLRGEGGRKAPDLPGAESAKIQLCEYYVLSPWRWFFSWPCIFHLSVRQAFSRPTSVQPCRS